jgi:hypothetical protein
MLGRGVLAQVLALPVRTGNYRGQDAATRHLGPIAQDFRAAFGLGQDDRHIGTVGTGAWAAREFPLPSPAHWGRGSLSPSARGQRLTRDALVIRQLCQERGAPPPGLAGSYPIFWLQRERIRIERDGPRLAELNAALPARLFVN